MKCTACGSLMISTGGENKEDFGCSNCPDCPCWSEIHYHSHLGVRDNWWFCTQYHLPFKYNNQWYCVVGPKYSYETKSIYHTKWNGAKEFSIFKKLVFPFSKMGPLNVILNKDIDLFSIPYMALPANDDFEREFNILKEKFKKLFILL